MMNIKGIFAVSLIAMVAVVAGTHTSNAVAAIASQGYVDQQIDTKVATAQGSAAANKAVITNASGNIITGTISSAMITDGTITNADIATNAQIAPSKVSGLAKVATSGSYGDLTGKPTIPTVNNGQLTINVNGTPHSFTANQAGGTTVDIDIPDEVDFSGLSGETTGNGNVVTNVTQTNGKVSATKGITAEETKNKVTSVRAAASATDTAYPSEKAVATALAGKVATAQGSGNTNKAVITNASGNIITGTISSAMITDGTITNADIASNAQIAQSKISGLTTALAGKEVTSNKVTSANYAANVSNDTKYPTVKAVADNIHNATLTIKKNGTSVGTFTANASADKEINIEVPAATTASDILTATTVTSSGTGAVLTGVSVEDGKVTLQKGNVQIPSGGQNATSYVSIWVE